jgi:hypothetical protein
MSDAGCPAHYEIRIEGVFDAAWFDDLQVYSDGTQTVISGRLADQTALHGLLTRIRDLGPCLVSVTRLDLGEPSG